MHQTVRLWKEAGVNPALPRNCQRHEIHTEATVSIFTEREGVESRHIREPGDFTTDTNQSEPRGKEFVMHTPVKTHAP